MGEEWLVLKRALRDYRTGLALLAVGLIALGLGIAGWEGRWDTRVYNALRLFEFHYEGGPERPGWELDTARFLAMGVTLAGLLVVLKALLREQWDLLRILPKRRHIIVCGLDGAGLPLIHSLKQNGTDVVAIDSDPALVTEGRRLGARVVAGSPLHANVLRRAGASRAEHLVALGRDDALNAGIVARAHEVPRAAHDQLQVFAHTTQPELAHHLTGGTFAGDSLRPAIQWVNIYDRAALAMLTKHADLSDERKRDGRYHLLVAGANNLATSLVLCAARSYRANASEDPLRVTVAAPDAAAWIGGLRARQPRLTGAIELVPYERDLRSVPDRSDLERCVDDVSAAFVCTDDDSHSLELAYALRRVTVRAPIVVSLLLESPGLRDLIAHHLSPAHDREPGIHVFSVAEQAPTMEMLTNGVHEILARALHEQYRVAVKASGKAEGYEWLCEWKDLPDTFKEANRKHARELSCKLVEARCGIRAASYWIEPIEFSDDQVERLAKIEHDRWVDERTSAGWGFGQERDEQHKLNPYMAKWHELPDNIKEYDREFVRELPKKLGEQGYELYRLDAGMPEPERPVTAS